MTDAPIPVTCTTCARSFEYEQAKLLDGGLNAQGWRCSGGTRVCPSCRAEEVEREAGEDENHG